MKSKFIVFKEFSLPIVIHARESYREIFDVLDEMNDDNLRGIFHCFSSNLKDANHILNYGGFKLGIGGVVTFKNAGLDKTLESIPLENIVLETDSPYLTPTPYRGKRNKSSYIPLIAKKLNEIYNLDITEIAKSPQRMLKKFSTYSLVLLFIYWVPSKIEAKDKFDLLIADEKNTTISLLTCDPGEEIYSLFGHSALRIQNPSQSINWVINSLFEFNENQIQFGYDFAKGRLNYYMGIQEMSTFIYEYNYYKRGVREQKLNLSNTYKNKLIKLIQENYRPEKRKYKYEFFYDNCSSRIRDIILISIGDELKWTKHPDANKYTYRQIIHQYLKYDPWLELGIDLVLGSKIDVMVDNKSLMFLPHYLESIIDQSTINEKTVLKGKI